MCSSDLNARSICPPIDGLLAAWLFPVAVPAVGSTISDAVSRPETAGRGSCQPSAFVTVTAGLWIPQYEERVRERGKMCKRCSKHAGGSMRLTKMITAVDTHAAESRGASSSAASCRNVVVVSTGTLDRDQPESWTGVIDRSPCGTGTCAKMAVLYSRGRLALDEAFRHEGILGTVFTGRLLRERSVPTAPSVRH